MRGPEVGTATRVGAAVAVLALAGGCAPVPPGAAPGGAAAAYHVYVAAESADRLHRVSFSPGSGAEVTSTVPVGRFPTENEGPHGIAISPDGEHLYLTTGHGLPDGKLWKYETGADTLVAREIGLGYFPATISVTPDGLFAFVANFNLHGERVPSSVSVVYTPDMTEVARTETCVMPHGSRNDPSGTRHYSVCMMDDRLVEIDTRTFAVARTLALPGSARGRCSPTWAEPSVDGSKVYVACNGADRIHEVDRVLWEVSRTIPTGRAPYNLEVTRDGRLLIATLKGESAVQFFEVATSQPVGKTPSSTTVTHGVVASPDSRYAFVTSEGVGSEPGRVDVYELDRFRRVASAAVGQQAGGIGFWRIER